MPTLAEEQRAEQEYIPSQHNHDEQKRHPTVEPEQDDGDIDEQAVRDWVEDAPVAALRVQAARQFAVEEVGYRRKRKDDGSGGRFTAVCVEHQDGEERHREEPHRRQNVGQLA